MMKNTTGGHKLHYTASIVMFDVWSQCSESVCRHLSQRKADKICFICQRRNSKIDTLFVLPLSDFVTLYVDVTWKMNKFSFSE